MAAISKDTLLRYCELVYDNLEAEAVPDESGTMLWEGKIVSFFHGLGISNAHYSRIQDTMKEIGSIELVRRGAKGSATVIALHQRPDADALERAHARPSGLTNPSPHDKLAQRVNVLETRLQGIDLTKYLANIEGRLRELERAEAKRGKRK